MDSTRIFVVVVVLAIAAAACGGADAATSQQTASGASWTSVDSTADVSTPPEGSDGRAGGDAAAPPAVPDACTLLTDSEASEVVGVAGLIGAATAPTDGYGSAEGSTECVWGDGTLRLTVSPLDDLGLGPDHLASTRQLMLDQRQGESVAGLGDGAKLGGANPMLLSIAAGRYLVDVRAYTADGTRLNAVGAAIVERLPRG